MNIPKIIKEQGLPSGEYIVVASGILNALNIRESQDIDLVISEDLYNDLLGKGWQEFDKGEYKVIEHDPFEAGLSWDSTDDETPNLEDLLKDAVYIQDVPFVGLKRVRAWKEKMNREKDIRDIKLIDDYIKRFGSY